MQSSQRRPSGARLGASPSEERLRRLVSRTHYTLLVALFWPLFLSLRLLLAAEALSARLVGLSSGLAQGGFIAALAIAELLFSGGGLRKLLYGAGPPLRRGESVAAPGTPPPLAEPTTPSRGQLPFIDELLPEEDTASTQEFTLAAKPPPPEAQQPPAHPISPAAPATPARLAAAPTGPPPSPEALGAGVEGVPELGRQAPPAAASAGAAAAAAAAAGPALAAVRCAREPVRSFGSMELVVPEDALPAEEVPERFAFAAAGAAEVGPAAAAGAPLLSPVSAHGHAGRLVPLAGVGPAGGQLPRQQRSQQRQRQQQAQAAAPQQSTVAALWGAASLAAAAVLTGVARGQPLRHSAAPAEHKRGAASASSAVPAPQAPQQQVQPSSHGDPAAQPQQPASPADGRSLGSSALLPPPAAPALGTFFAPGIQQLRRNLLEAEHRMREREAAGPAVRREEVSLRQESLRRLRAQEAALAGPLPGTGAGHEAAAAALHSHPITITPEGSPRSWAGSYSGDEQWGAGPSQAAQGAGSDSSPKSPLGRSRLGM